MGSKSMCNSDEEGELRRGPWTLEEDNLLLKYISCQGEGRWNLLAKCAGLKRTGKSCRLRWLNYLKPDVKRGNLTPQEQLLILELHSQWGNKWSKIAQHLPGRTDNEIKNYWRTRVQKQARQLKIDSNSKSFLDAVRYFWAPNMHQTNDQVVSPPHFPSSSSTMNSTMPSPITNMPSSPSPSAVPGINHADNYASLISPTSMSSAHLLQNSQFPEVLEHPINPYSFDNSFNDHAIPNGNFSVVDNCSYDMGDYNPHPTSAMGIYDISMSDYPIAAGGDWASGDMEQTVPIWNMDELWQFEPRIDDH